MGNIAEARKRINEVIKEKGEELDSSSLGLKTKELNRLFPLIIKMLPDIKRLNLSDNEITVLPRGIGNLTGLLELDVSGNKLTGLPVEIGNLVNLRYLDLHNNRIVGLPVEIGKLTSLKNFYLHYTPSGIRKMKKVMGSGSGSYALSSETMNWLQYTLKGRVSARAKSKVQNSKKVIKKLYKEKAEEMISKIDGLKGNKAYRLKRKKFGTIKGSSEKTVPAQQVLSEFLARSPHDMGGLQTVYDIVLKYSLDEIFNAPDEASKKTLLQVMANSLDDSSSTDPVRSFLTRKAIGLSRGKPEIFTSGLITRLIEREALEKEVRRVLNISANETERQMSGFSGRKYLKEAEAIPVKKKKKKKGKRPKKSSGSENPDFAFQKEAENEWIEPLAKTCCKTDKDGEPLVDKDGYYELDPGKLENIKNKYKTETLLAYSDTEKYVEKSRGRINKDLEGKKQNNNLWLKAFGRK
ncbi:leucine-rich repeat domain-containing protein [Abyssalbus ytuae]|uniref:Leucine-rich repeat domain-containing protein n=1 Tax=Abyssalbus ytuae TaxID=2926907 RepID=A0A9E7D3C4_9FLAO|nr:leucine-rich repeat domain-containing protein [Abyssalbus ytuae]UOB19148.1 leucine-rich repeat domain-containing protein [Abyssalbus ytuae]